MLETYDVVVVRQLKPVKKKNTFEGFLHFTTDFPSPDFSRWLLGYQYVQSSLYLLDANSKE